MMERKRAPQLDQPQLKFIFGGLELLRRDILKTGGVSHVWRFPDAERQNREINRDVGEFEKLVELQKTVLNAAKSGGLVRLNVLDRVDLRLMSEGLDLLKEEMRSLGYEIDMQKYNQVDRVQDKIDNARGSTFY